MGYDLHITRREFWFDEGEDIDFSEWTTFVARAPDMQFDGCAETSIEMTRHRGPNLLILQFGRSTRSMVKMVVALGFISTME